MARRTLADLLAQDDAEAEAQYWRDDAEADAIAERRNEQFWEENRSPAYQAECEADLQLFEETWQWSPGFWDDVDPGLAQGNYRDDEYRATNEDYR